MKLIEVEILSGQVGPNFTGGTSSVAWSLSWRSSWWVTNRDYLRPVPRPPRWPRWPLPKLKTFEDIWRSETLTFHDFPWLSTGFISWCLEPSSSWQEKVSSSHSMSLSPSNCEDSGTALVFSECTHLIHDFDKRQSLTHWNSNSKPETSLIHDASAGLHELLCSKTDDTLARGWSLCWAMDFWDYGIRTDSNGFERIRISDRAMHIYIYI